jgi:hypothetical protein
MGIKNRRAIRKMGLSRGADQVLDDLFEFLGVPPSLEALRRSLILMAATLAICERHRFEPEVLRHLVELEIARIERIQELRKETAAQNGRNGEGRCHESDFE